MSTNGPPPVAFPQDFGSPFAQEFLLHPDFRIIAGFLLGWVFWSGLSYACRTQFFQLLGHIIWNFLRRAPPTQSDPADIEAQDAEKKAGRRESRLSAIHRISNEAALTFTLNLCFAFAGFAEFCSLLAYDSRGDTTCAFTVAWGAMAAQAARLIGLLMLVLELHHQGASNAEFYCLCLALVIGLSFILAYTATNTGALVIVRTLGVSFCDRTPWAPTALLSSIGFIVFELYAGGRFLGWDARKVGFGAMLAKSANIYVARACSLLVLDLLTIVPNAMTTNQIAQFIPLSVGALIVLVVYNYTGSTRLVDSTSRVPSPLPTVQPSRKPTPLPLAARPTPDPAEIIDIPRSDSRRTYAELERDDSPEVPPPIARSSRDREQSVTPSSAPPRIGDKPVFAEYQTRQILPFQVAYAEQLERHVHTGPIVVPIRAKRQRPHVQVIIEDTEPPERQGTMRPSIIGSDILRMPSAATTSSKRLWSPDTNMTPSDYTSSRRGSESTPTTTTRTPTTVRDSTLSMMTPSRSQSASSRMALSAAMSRQSSRRIVRSPGEGSLKLPWRSAPRQSFASARTFGGREELSIVVEGQAGSSVSRDPSRVSTSSATATKRMIISRPHSLRSLATRPPSPQPSRLGKELPNVPSVGRRSTSPYLTVPRSPGLPPSPRSGLSIRPSSQYIVPSPSDTPQPRLPSPSPAPATAPVPGPLPTSPPASYARAQGSGRLRGPRSPPMSSSTPNLRTGWPVADQAPREDHQRHSRRRSGSCPELPPLELGNANLRSVGGSIRQ